MSAKILLHSLPDLVGVKEGEVPVDAMEEAHQIASMLMRLASNATELPNTIMSRVLHPPPPQWCLPMQFSTPHHKHASWGQRHIGSLRSTPQKCRNGWRRSVQDCSTPTNGHPGPYALDQLDLAFDEIQTDASGFLNYHSVHD